MRLKLLIAAVVALTFFMQTVAAVGEEGWWDLINQYQWDSVKAEKVMMCESGGDPGAYNPAGPYVGLFQIWEGHRWTAEELLVPEINVAAAYEKYQQNGWQPWPECGLQAGSMTLPGTGHGPQR